MEIYAYKVDSLASALVQTGYLAPENQSPLWSTDIAAAFFRFVDHVLETCPLSEVPEIIVSPNKQWVQIKGGTKCPPPGGRYDDFNFNGTSWIQALESGDPTGARATVLRVIGTSDAVASGFEETSSTPAPNGGPRAQTNLIRYGALALGAGVLGLVGYLWWRHR
ncbi:MAG: hypothetical protein ACREKH_12270, partial [Candidatus Rokuibacteriota bacterium]